MLRVQCCRDCISITEPNRSLIFLTLIAMSRDELTYVSLASSDSEGSTGDAPLPPLQRDMDSSNEPSESGGDLTEHSEEDEFRCVQVDVCIQPSSPVSEL